jgi:hypothetical protein
MSSPPVTPSGEEDESVCSLSSAGSREDECPASATPGVASATSGAFQQWFENDQNVLPDRKIAYLMMMMTTIDDQFQVEHVIDKRQRNKKEVKPLVSMYKQEIRRRDKTCAYGQAANKNKQETLTLLKGPLKLTDPLDILFVRTKVLEYTNKILSAAAEKSVAGSSRTQTKKIDRLRFVECMVLDHIKPLYLKANEVMTRHQLDGRNSDNVPPDFYDVVTGQFNDPSFAPYSRVLPDLHEDFAVAICLPLPDDYRMSPDRAKNIIATMKPKILKISANYELSGNGDGMRGDQEEDDDASGRFSVSNCIAGDNKRSFLSAKDSSDLLYWWHVLEEEDMLQYTLAIFPTTVGVTSESVKSLVTSSSEKTRDHHKAITAGTSEIANQLGAMSRMMEEDNVLRRESNEMKQRMIRYQGDQVNLQKQMKVRELEREIEAMQDVLLDDPTTTESKKRRLLERIDNLRNKITILENGNDN